MVRVLLKHRVPALVHDGRLIADSRLVLVNTFSGVVLDGRGYAAAYVGEHQWKLSGKETTLLLEGPDGGQYPAELVGVDQRIAVLVARSDALAGKAAVLGSSIRNKLRFAGWNEAGRWDSADAGVLRASEESGQPERTVRAQFASQEERDSAPPGSLVWDSEGRFLGFVTQSGLGALNRSFGVFSILPAAVVRQSMDLVVKSGSNVPAGWLGIVFDSEIDAVRVKEVVPGSPAFEAGLRQGDYIEQVEGMDIESRFQFARFVRWAGPGARLALGLASDDEKKRTVVELGEYPRHERIVYGIELQIPKVWAGDEIVVPSERIQLRPVLIPSDFDLGLSVDSISDQLAQFFKSPVDYGLLVKSVIGGSVSSKAGFQAGDILLDINGTRMAYPSDLRQVLASTTDGVFVVRFVRAGRVQQVSIAIQ